MTAYFDTYAHMLSTIERALSDAKSEDDLIPYTKPRNGLDVGGPWERAVRVDMDGTTPRAWLRPWDWLAWVEREVVRDVTLCAEWPGCPPAVRDAIHEAVLRYAPNAQPPGVPGPDYEDDMAQARGLSRMISDLHTIFHDLAHHGLDLFSDAPTAPLCALEANGDVRRTVMRPVPLRYWRMQIDGVSEDPELDGALLDAIGQHAHDHAIYCNKTPAEARTARAEVMRVLRMRGAKPEPHHCLAASASGYQCTRRPGHDHSHYARGMWWITDRTDQRRSRGLPAVWHAAPADFFMDADDPARGTTNGQAVNEVTTAGMEQPKRMPMPWPTSDTETRWVTFETVSHAEAMGWMHGNRLGTYGQPEGQWCIIEVSAQEEGQPTRVQLLRFDPPNAAASNSVEVQP